MLHVVTSIPRLPTRHRPDDLLPRHSRHVHNRRGGDFLRRQGRERLTVSKFRSGVHTGGIHRQRRRVIATFVAIRSLNEKVYVRIVEFLAASANRKSDVER